jgi:hypothetical protein
MSLKSDKWGYEKFLPAATRVKKRKILKQIQIKNDTSASEIRWTYIRMHKRRVGEKKLIQSRGDNMQLNLLLFPLSLEQMCFGVAIPTTPIVYAFNPSLSRTHFLPKCYLWKFQTFHIRVEYCGGAGYTDIKYKRGWDVLCVNIKHALSWYYVHGDGVFAITLKMCVE